MKNVVRILVMKRQFWHVTCALLAAMAGCAPHGGAASSDEEHSTQGAAHVTVRTELSRVGVLTETVDGLGRCEALPDHIATLTPAVEGHVHELLVSQGDAVKKGQPIVELDRAVAQADLEEKTATRDGLRASLTLLKSLPRPEERRANELAVEQAKVALEQAKVSADRLRPLIAHREVPEQQLLDAERAVKQADIQLETAKATLHAMVIGPRPEAVAEAEGKIKTADALVAFSGAHLDFHTIRAPIDGVLDSLTCRPGQTIAIGTPIGEVVDTRLVFASVWLPPRSVSSVRVGQPAVVQPGDALEPLPDSASVEKKRMTGKVVFLGRMTDPQTGNLPVRVLAENPQGWLTIGQSIRVSIVVNEHKSVLQVPASAILDLGEGPIFSVVRDGKSIVLHPEVGASHEGWVAVSGTDLKEGEPVIVEGGYNLPEKTEVKLSNDKAEAKENAQTEAKEAKS
jgi:RND family efflux transporter MFP subunit